MSFKRLFVISPLGCVGMLLTGGIFSAMFGMASVWGAMIGLSIGQIAAFVAALYVGGLVLQYPIGWISDRLDRRVLVFWMSATGSLVMLIATATDLPFNVLLVVAALLGGTINPLYSLLIAHTNDFLGKEDMAAASAGLIFLNGFGAIFGPLITGWMMGLIGPEGFFLFIGILFAVLASYAAWRMARRTTPEGSSGYAGLTPTASSLIVGVVMGKERRRAKSKPQG